MSETIVPSDGPLRLEEIDIDLPVLVGAFTERLRLSGIPVTPEHSIHFAQALSLVKPISRRRLYATARAVLVSDMAQLNAFDAVFFSIFGKRDDKFIPDEIQTVAAPPDERPKPKHKKQVPESRDQESGPDMSSAAAGDEDDDEDEDDGNEVEVPIAQASDDERLGRKSFDALEPHELAQLYKLMTRIELATPTRRTRRKRSGRRGEHVDMRRTLRKSLRTAGDPINLSHRHRRVLPRRLVLLCDISGSMEPYARAYLQFLMCATGAGPNAEAFVFATRLTRLTRALGGRNPERAIQRAAAAAPDWSSGTRIGDALKRFNDTHGRRGMARGAVVVILSDGWERGDPALVGREMERLARLAYKIVWVNPRVSASDFAPRAGGMAAALPHCDALVSGHTLRALGEVADAIACETWDRRSSPMLTYKPPSSDDLEDEEEEWGSATPVRGSSFAMPSGEGPSRGNTTPGWADE
ncbi:MAG TPA: VWA domain-containing protein [Solirubrobacteraceae bacterium]|nr:VWA domain-containing protein [Solirubrobacteraceae bacterium]